MPLRQISAPSAPHAPPLEFFNGLGGFDKDGRIQAIDVDVIFDGGAYLTLTPVVLSRGVLHAAGPYKCETTRVRGRAVATHTPPHGAFRGFGAPQTTFAYERQMQKAARLLGMSDLELRELVELELLGLHGLRH